MNCIETKGSNPHDPHRRVLQSLRSRYIEIMNAHIPADQPVALVDFPHHANVGDSAIWLGEIEYLKKRNCRVVYACTHGSFNEKAMKRRVNNDTLVLIHGGGNFGDLWPAHHRFLHAILGLFPKNRILQLPQSIHWSSEEKMRKDFETLNRHDRFHMLVRDRASYDIFASHSRHPVTLCPDSAFCLELKRVGVPETEYVCLMRTDHEQSKRPIDLPVTGEDWLVDSKDAGFRLARKALRLCQKVRIDRRVNVLPLFNRLAGLRLLRGCKQLSRGEIVITDRLHAHILCTLMGIPHVVLDNSYGKLSRFRQAWTSEFPGHVLLEGAAGIEDAVSELRRGAKAFS